MIPLLVLVGTIGTVAVSAAAIFIGKAMASRQAAQRDRFNWLLPIYAALGALILFVPIMIYGDDIDEMLYIFVAAPIIGLILIVVAICKKGRRGLAVFGMLVVYCAISWGLYKNSRELHWTTRWLLWSKDYKAKVLAQPSPAAGELRHVEWDVWGWGGNETVVYLVFDPNDSLSVANKSHSSGKFNGIPCEVYRVRRLENHYYAVHFYTDTGWNQCNY
jgi:hypothetical protein